jgi:hypothetical protein
MDADLIFCCFRYIGEKGAVSAVDSPVVKFKVGDNNNDLIIKSTVFLEDDTFVGEDVAVRVFANGDAVGDFVITRKASQVVGISVPKELIKSDGTVSVKFCAINELKTEKELGRSEKNIKRGLAFKDISVAYAAR